MTITLVPTLNSASELANSPSVINKVKIGNSIKIHDGSGYVDDVIPNKVSRSDTVHDILPNGDLSRIKLGCDTDWVDLTCTYGGGKVARIYNQDFEITPDRFLSEFQFNNHFLPDLSMIDDYNDLLLSMMMHIPNKIKTAATNFLTQSALVDIPDGAFMMKVSVRYNLVSDTSKTYVEHLNVPVYLDGESTSIPASERFMILIRKGDQSDIKDKNPPYRVRVIASDDVFNYVINNINFLVNG